MSAYTNIKAVARDLAGGVGGFFVTDRFRSIDIIWDQNFWELFLLDNQSIIV